MPKYLLQRCRPDSIREFRAAARVRFDDGLALAGQGRRTGAIDHWGYTAEMIVKAAYFAMIGIPETAPLDWRRDFLLAIAKGRNTFFIPWTRGGEGHNVRAWTELLIAERAASPSGAYNLPLGLELQRRGQRIERIWRETLRYRKNQAYSHELATVKEAAEWLLVHSDSL